MSRIKTTATKKIKNERNINEIKFHVLRAILRIDYEYSL